MHAKINLPAIADHSAAAPTRLAAASRGLSFRPLPSFFAPFKSGIGYTYVFGRRSDGDTNNNPVPGLNGDTVASDRITNTLPRFRSATLRRIVCSRYARGERARKIAAAPSARGGAFFCVFYCDKSF